MPPDALPLPIHVFRWPDEKLISQTGDAGELMPLFCGSFSPKKFLLEIGIRQSVTAHRFDSLRNFAEFLRVAVFTSRSPDEIRFVVNPTDADLGKCPSFSAAELLARIDPTPDRNGASG